MLRTARLLIGLVALAVVVTFAVANRAPVEIHFWPLPLAIELPVYGILLIGFLLGVVVTGFVAFFEVLRLRLYIRKLERHTHDLETRMKLQEELQEEAELRTSPRSGNRMLAAGGS